MAATDEQAILLHKQISSQFFHFRRRRLAGVELELKKPPLNRMRFCREGISIPIGYCFYLFSD
jgi:hypothetical protein